MDAVAVEGERLETRLQRWNLDIDGPLRATRHAHLQPVRLSESAGGASAAMLKLASAASDEHHAGFVLQHWRGLGAIAVHAHEGRAMLMERARPAPRWANG